MVASNNSVVARWEALASNGHIGLLMDIPAQFAALGMLQWTRLQLAAS